MKSLHVPFGFFPDVSGGTEVYVAALAESLGRRRHPAVIAAPARSSAHYLHNGLDVHRFAITDDRDVSDLYGDGDPLAADEFGRILDREHPDLVHLHAFTRACSVKLVRKAKERGTPVVFTYHTPTVSCARGTMMLWGEAPCDGALHVSRCAACALHGRGVPKTIAAILGRVPPAKATASARLQGRAWTALRFSSLIARQQTATRALFDEVDRIIALRDWVRALLVANGVPDSKIVSSKHALCHGASPLRPRTRGDGPLRVAFLGRLNPTKGLDVLLRALRQIPHANILLDVYGAIQEGGVDELARLRQLANGDSRVTFRPAVDSSAVLETIAAHDVLAVPSQWMETGPLVVLEAFAAGVPVIGSSLGGIVELVTDGTDGLLVRDFASPAAWAALLERLGNEPALLATLSAGIRMPVTMDQVASEMITVYEALTHPVAAPPRAAAISSVA